MDWRAICSGVLASVGTLGHQPTLADLDGPRQMIWQYDLEPVKPYVAKKPTGWLSSFSGAEQDIRLLAMTGFGESRGDGVIGMTATMNVVLNRSVRYEMSVHDVVFSRLQFTCWYDRNRELLRHLDSLTGLDKVRWEQAKKIARRLYLAKHRVDPTEGATMYHTIAISPSWLRDVKLLTTIGHHRFYRKLTEEEKTRALNKGQLLAIEARRAHTHRAAHFVSKVKLTVHLARKD